MTRDPVLPPEGGAPRAARTGRAFLELAPLAGILSLAAALRFYALGRDGLWADEAFTAVWAGLPLADLLAQLREDCHAPLSYVVAKLLLGLSGDGEWQVRLPSAILGVSAVGLIYLAGRRLLSREGGLLAAFLLATSPIHIHYSREARPYSLLVFLCTLSLLLALAIQRRPRRWLMACCAACLAAVLYTHNVGIFFVAALLGTFALSAIRVSALPDDSSVIRALASLRTWLIVACLTLVGYLPWLTVAVRQAAQADDVFAWARSGWEQRFPWQPLLSAVALAHGALAPIRNEAREFPPLAWIALGLAVILVVRGVLSAHWRLDGAAPRLLLAGSATLGGIFAYSLARTPIYVVGRVDVIVLPLFVLLLSGGLVALGRRAGRLAALALALTAVAPVHRMLTIDVRSQEKLIASFLASSMDRRDALVVTGPFLASQQYYLGASRPDIRVRAFPVARERHPGWVDWSGYGEVRLASEADLLAAEIRGGTPQPPSIWLLLHPHDGNATMAGALARIAREMQAYTTGYLGITLIRARVVEDSDAVDADSVPCLSADPSAKQVVCLAPPRAPPPASCSLPAGPSVGDRRASTAAHGRAGRWRRTERRVPRADPRGQASEAEIIPLPRRADVPSASRPTFGRRGPDHSFSSERRPIA